MRRGNLLVIPTELQHCSGRSPRPVGLAMTYLELYIFVVLGQRGFLGVLLYFSPKN